MGGLGKPANLNSKPKALHSETITHPQNKSIKPNKHKRRNPSSSLKKGPLKDTDSEAEEDEETAADEGSMITGRKGSSKGSFMGSIGV